MIAAAAPPMMTYGQGVCQKDLLLPLVVVDAAAGLAAGASLGCVNDEAGGCVAGAAWSVSDAFMAWRSGTPL
jgi:hypothetical protein